MDPLKLRLKHLSQEHQAAQQLAKAMRSVQPENDEDLPALGARIALVFRTEMEPHFLEEERHVIPKLIAIGRRDLADRTVSEHLRIRNLVDGLAAPTRSMLTELSHALESHVRFEEEELWEVLEAALHDEAAVTR